MRILLLLVGVATFYSHNERGESRLAADGGLLNAYEYYAAHREFPLKTRARVCALQTERCVLIRVRDAGPWVLDLDTSVQDPDWSQVVANRVYGVWAASPALMVQCRNGHGCDPPRGFKWRGDIDLNRPAWDQLGLDWRQGRARVRIERM
jgi:rare lipoprotein A (RlpA)-like double-psi beta-barrel protein